MTDETRTGGDAPGASEQATTDPGTAGARSRTSRGGGKRDTGATGATGAAGTTRRRRATAPAAAVGPDRDDAFPGQDPPAEPQTSEGGGDAPSGRKTSARGSRTAARTTGTRGRSRGAAADKGAAADQDAERGEDLRSAEVPESADGAAGGTDDDAATSPAAAPTRTRRGRGRATAATTDAGDADRGEPADDSPSAEAASPRRATRRRATRTSTTTDASESPDAAEAPAGSTEPPQAAQATPDEAAEESSTAVRVGGSPRLATTAVLFQAPEPTARPRRRRAEAPAGPPRHAETGQPEPGQVEPGQVEEADEDEASLEAAAPADAEQGPGDAAEGAGPVGGADEAEDKDEAENAAQGGDGGDAEGDSRDGGRRRRRRGGRGRRRSGGDRAAGDDADEAGAGTQPAAPAEGEAEGTSGADAEADAAEAEGGEGDTEGSSSSRRRRRRRRSRGGDGGEEAPERPRARTRSDEVTALKGSTRLEAKRQRRREGRDAGRRRAVITEAEFLARREAVERTMVVREHAGRVQIAILEDGVLVEHYVSRSAQNTQAPMAGNVYLGRVQNVLPSMEAAFVDIGKGRNAVLYAGEVNWDAVGLEGQPRRIEQALKSGDPVLVQVTKEPVGHKGARLTSQITLAGRYLVYVPGGGMTGISRKLPENERARLKKILREIVPDDAGVIVRTAAEGASDDELRRDVQRLQDQWAAIQKKAGTASPPSLLQGEPDLAIRVVRDVFNDDFDGLVVQGDDAWSTISDYVGAMAPDLAAKLSRWGGEDDVFAAHRVEEQLAKGMDRKVWLPSGGSLVIDRTEAMTVIDVNTGKFTGSGGTLEETVTRNNLEAAEEIVRQLRLRDIGGIIVIDFIDMVLESNRDLVLRRLVECLGRDRTKHQVAEVTSLGLVQMTRKRVGQGLLEAFSEPCPHCGGRGYLVHTEPVTRTNGDGGAAASEPEPKKAKRKRGSGSGSGSGTATGAGSSAGSAPAVPVLPAAREAVKATLATIAAAAAHAHEQASQHDATGDGPDAVLSEPGTPVDAGTPEDPGTAEDAGAPGAALDLADALDSVAAVETPAAGGAPDPAAGGEGQAEAPGAGPGPDPGSDASATED